MKDLNNQLLDNLGEFTASSRLSILMITSMYEITEIRKEDNDVYQYLPDKLNTTGISAPIAVVRTGPIIIKYTNGRNQGGEVELFLKS